MDESSAATSAKLEALVELVATLRETGHRALVFSQFVGFLELARDALDASGAKTMLLHGGTPGAERASLVAAFQSGAADVFLISLKAGGTGLNLTAADTVIHLDPWWNPAVEDQATDRSHRIGQNRPVTVVRLVARGTVEEAVVALHADKRALARAVLDGADGATPLDTSELLALLEAGATESGWDAGEEEAAPEEAAADEDGAAPPDGAAALDLASLDGLIDRAVARFETGRPSGTAAQYRRALLRFREFVAAGRALHATSWSAAADCSSRRCATGPGPLRRASPAPASATSRTRCASESLSRDPAPLARREIAHLASRRPPETCPRPVRVRADDVLALCYRLDGKLDLAAAVLPHGGEKVLGSSSSEGVLLGLSSALSKPITAADSGVAAALGVVERDAPAGSDLAW